jgi:hypothetical protein
MKRAAWILSIFVVPLFAASAAPAGTDTGSALLLWVNQLRGRQGLPELATDPLLQQTAAAYAADLASRGVLSHVDQLGGRALQRFRGHGGTAALVGEILGSGLDFRAVVSVWEHSPSHREVVCNPLWTHCGGSSVRCGETGVWVVMFASRRIEPLRILLTADGYVIRGRLNSGEALEPVLFSGIERLVPLDWDAASRQFSFLVPVDRGELFHRLGYRSEAGALVVTDTFYPLAAVTSGRGREPR